MKNKILILILGMILISSCFVSASDNKIWFGRNESNPSQMIPVLLTNTGVLRTDMNFSVVDIWNTNIGQLSNVNATQFINIANALTIDTSWLSSFIGGAFFKTDGTSVMQGSANIGGFDIFNVDNIDGSGNFTTTGNITANTYFGNILDIQGVSNSGSNISLIAGSEGGNILLETKQGAPFSDAGNITLVLGTSVTGEDGSFNVGSTFKEYMKVSNEGSSLSGVGVADDYSLIIKNTLPAIATGITANIEFQATTDNFFTGRISSVRVGDYSTEEDRNSELEFYTVFEGFEHLGLTLGVVGDATFSASLSVDGTLSVDGISQLDRRVTIGVATGETNDKGQIRLRGEAGGPFSRGGEINWRKNRDASAGFTYADFNSRFVWNPSAQSTHTDAGVAWVDFDDGSATFAGGLFDIDADGNIDGDGYLALGANGIGGLGAGDMNVSIIYYDVLTAKSPMFMCSDDWCSVSFPKRQKTLWLQKDDNYTILDIVYEDVHYTKSEFNSQICQINEMTQEICLKLNNKIKYLQDKKQADILLQQQKDNCNYNWNGTSCFEIVKNIATYEEAISLSQINETISINSTCYKLDDELRITSYDCSKTIETSNIIDKYIFKNSCSWEEDNYYYCETRESR